MRVFAVLALTCLALAPSKALAQDYRGKITVGVYASDQRTTVDLNARYTAQAWTGWFGWYGPQADIRQPRAGLEYDLRRKSLLLIPSVQIASASFVGGSVYGEIGQTLYAIAGASRTNLRPYVNLNFDPNESWQLGAGAHFKQNDSLAAFTVWDNRLHTAQQNSHVVLRHSIADAKRITLDVSYKSGRGETGAFVRGAEVATEVDWRRWFAKGARDAHANFGTATMWRFGGGLRF